MKVVINNLTPTEAYQLGYEDGLKEGNNAIAKALQSLMREQHLDLEAAMLLLHLPEEQEDMFAELIISNF